MFDPFANSSVGLEDGQISGSSAARNALVSERTPIQRDASGETIANYLLEELIGCGGMGSVYRARNMRDGTPVAIKRLRSDLYHDANLLARFKREIRIGELQHRYVAPVIDSGDSVDGPYFVMPLAQESLANLIIVYRDPAAAVRLLAKVARGVDAAHALGIYHRDLKPGNILIGRNGDPMVADFGLAKLRDRSDSNLLTVTGAIIGTIPYMAPEQSYGNSDDVGAATDVWSLGVILFELLAGQRPFDGAKPSDTLERIRKIDPPSLRQLRPAVDRRLHAIVSTCLQKRIKDRYQSAGELADDLEAWMHGRPVAALYRQTVRHRLLASLRRTSRSTWLGLGYVALLSATTVGLSVSADRPVISAVATAEALDDVHHRLRHGQPVSLIQPRRLPGWHHWELGRKGTGKLMIAPGGGTRIESSATDLLTLVKQPPPNFRLEADFRRLREAANSDSFGLFAGHRRIEGETRQFEAYCTIGPFSFRSAQGPKVDFGLKIAAVGGAELYRGMGICPLAPARPDNVYHVEMTVTPEGFAGSVNGQPVIALLKDVRREVTIAYKSRLLQSNTHALPPDGACGIVVRESAIDVLRVTITPLTSEK